ncbi:response regulator receiver domain [Bradyrhizobium sp. BTAi1]|uniref:response regulator receiver domain n=1 Tax=Bradyrhizobium sp. (strain BTAi1 / ATCC BAA-1182) TaxID=288000 RepID=UPI00059F880B|nr:response regulator receiver domain [Bradyrhizobium sp. BTAi1]
MPDAAYEAVVIETFEKKPLRTVLMIDDEFPTFSDLAAGESRDNAKRFRQKLLATAMYEGFKRSNMICDIENGIVADQSERLRKSDLVVLDYHLGPGENNSEQSIRLLRDLAHSKHFNTVVVYTNEPKLDDVWLEIISCIRGGWSRLPASLTDQPAAEWERLVEKELVPESHKEALMQFVARGRMGDIEPSIKSVLTGELEEREIATDILDIVLEALLHHQLGAIARDYSKLPSIGATGGFAGGVRWIQSQNAFIAILQKVDLPEDRSAPVDEKDPVGIMAGLRKALLAWQPNLVQILVSEIQNVLELDALATADGQLQKSDTQTALWYYLLQSLGTLDLERPPDVSAPIISIIDKVLDGIRQRLISDEELLRHASDALIGSLRETGWTSTDWPTPSKRLFEGARKLARADGLVDLQQTIFRLNTFFSTEDFARAHLTTGAIFRSVATDTYWVVSSPACDLEDRQPGAYQAWARSIDPLTAVVALRLERYPRVDRALKDATTGKYIFLEQSAGDQKAFKIVDDAGVPSYEFFFAHNRGRITRNGARKVFTANRLFVNEESPTGILSAEEFEIVQQLRDLNASRTLLVAGQHLSRIGVDFIKMPA